MKVEVSFRKNISNEATISSSSVFSKLRILVLV